MNSPRLIAWFGFPVLFAVAAVVAFSSTQSWLYRGAVFCVVSALGARALFWHLRRAQGITSEPRWVTPAFVVLLAIAITFGAIDTFDNWTTRIIAIVMTAGWMGASLAFYRRRIEGFREQARAILRDRFDDAAFDQMLQTRTFGETLAYSVEQWIAERKKDA